MFYSNNDAVVMSCDAYQGNLTPISALQYSKSALLFNKISIQAERQANKQSPILKVVAIIVAIIMINSPNILAICGTEMVSQRYGIISIGFHQIQILDELG